MAVFVVDPSSAIDMIGPYLAAKVRCPCCRKENILLRLEGPVSSVRAIDICNHLKAHFINDDGESQFEFEGEPHDVAAKL